MEGQLSVVKSKNLAPAPATDSPRSVRQGPESPKQKVSQQGGGGRQAKPETKHLWQHPFVNIFKLCSVERWTDAHYEGDVQLYIDRTIGKMCYRISGSIPAKNYLQVPKKKMDSLGLTGRFLYAMVCVHPSKMFVMHFDLVVEEGYTVRLSISNMFKGDEQDVNTVKLCYKPTTDKWTVLALDLKGILKAGTGRVFRCLKGMQFCSRMLVKNAYTSDILYSAQTLPRDMLLLQSSKADQLTAWQWIPEALGFQSGPTISRPQSRLASLSPDDCKENVDVSRLPEQRMHVMKGAQRRASPLPFPQPLPAKVTSSASRQTSSTREQNAARVAVEKQNSSSARGRRPSRLSVQREPLLGLEARDVPGSRDPSSEGTASPISNSRQLEVEPAPTNRESVDLDDCAGSTSVRVVRHQPESQNQAHEESETSGASTSSGTGESVEAKDVYIVEEPRAVEAPPNELQGPGVSREPSGLGFQPVMKLEKVVGFSGQRTGSVLYSPDGSAVVFPSTSTIIAMNPSTGSQRFFMGNSAPICSLAFDAKGTLLASAQEGKHAIIRVWDFASGTCLAVLMAHASGLTSVDLSADGKALLAVGLDQQARQLIVVWDITHLVDGNRAIILAKHTTDHHVLTARFSPLEENHLMTCGRNSIRMYRLKNGQLKGCSVNLAEHRQQALLKHIDKGSPAEIVFTDLAYQLGYGLTELYEKRVYVATSSGSVFQVNYGKLAVERVYHLHTEAIHSLAVTEGFCITGSQDRRLRVWPLEFSEYFMEMELEGDVVATSVRSDGLHVAFGTKSGSVGTLDIGNHRNQTLLRSHRDKVVALALDPLHPQFATISTDRTVRIWALESMEQLYEFDAPGDCPTCLAYHPRERALACGFQSGMVRVFAIENTTVVHERRQHRGPVAQVLFLSSGAQLVSSGEEGNLCIYDATREYAPAKILATPTGRRHVAMAATSDGSALAAIGPDGKSIVLYGSADWSQAPRTFSTLSSRILKLAFAPDARSLFVLTTDSRLEKYDVATGKMLASTVDVHRGACQALAVSPDGALVATGGSDRMIKIWRSDLVSSPQSFAGQDGSLLCVAFTNHPSPCLLTVGEGNAILRWQF